MTIKKKVAKELTAPVAAGMAVGQVDYYVGEDLVASFPVTASETVGKWDLEFCVKTLLNGFYSVIMDEVLSDEGGRIHEDCAYKRKGHRTFKRIQ